MNGTDSESVGPLNLASAVVVGGGTMGAGIAESLLLTMPGNVQVTVLEADPRRSDQVRTSISEAVARHASPDGRDAAIARLHVLDFENGVVATEPQLVIEAVPEREELKASVLSVVADRWPSAIIASNTSSLSLTRLSQTVSDPTRFVGMHFFNPVPRSELVELVVPQSTALSTIEWSRAFIRALGKEVIQVGDFPGFATSRLGVAIGLEAIRMVEDGVASPEDIDRGMVLGYKFPIGPLRLTDLVGIDVRLAIADYLSAELGDRFEAPKLMRDMVTAGRLGKKSGQGFYSW